MITQIKFNMKKLRAAVIKKYLKNNNIPLNVVSFSCGNASKELINVGFNVIDISPNGIFNANKWFTQADIKNIFGNYFDATSGHLSLELMNLIADSIKIELGILEKKEYTVNSGSGESIICLALAYPKVEFHAVYNNKLAETTFDYRAPLNRIVGIIAKSIKIYD